MEFIPLQSVASQTLSVTLANQVCTINVYQKSTGLFVDLYVNGVLIIGGVLALQANLTVRSLYLGFIGDLVFYDTQGDSTPYYTGLGSRWVLAYLSPSEAAA